MEKDNVRDREATPSNTTAVDKKKKLETYTKNTHNKAF